MYAQAMSTKQWLQIPQGLTCMADILRGSCCFGSLVMCEVFCLCWSVRRSMIQLNTGTWILLKYFQTALPHASREADQRRNPVLLLPALAAHSAPAFPSLPLTDIQWTQSRKWPVWKTGISFLNQVGFHWDRFSDLSLHGQRNTCADTGGGSANNHLESTRGPETHFGCRTGFCQLN